MGLDNLTLPPAVRTEQKESVEDKAPVWAKVKLRDPVILLKEVLRVDSNRYKEGCRKSDLLVK